MMHTLPLSCLMPGSSFFFQATISPTFRSSYTETLAKLEHQYCKLLVRGYVTVIAHVFK